MVGRETTAMSDSAIAQLLECGLLRPSFVPPPEIHRLRMLTAGPVTTRPTSGQDWHTQPLTMAPSRVAEQNRAAIASWLEGLCGHTTHASLSVASAASSSSDACSRSRTSAEVEMGI
jgi:hypothetical protein